MEAFNEQRVGLPQNFAVPEFLPDDAQPSHLPLAERLSSKDSKVRFDATCELFEELKKGSETSISTQKDLEDYRSTLIKLLADTHPGVQEKSLDCFQILVNMNSKLFGIKEIVNVIMEKCQSKPSIKVKAIDSLLSTAEGSNVVYLVCKEYLDPKSGVVKHVTALHILGQLLENFGEKSFPVQNTITQAVSCVKSKNAAVKNEAIKYLCEAHRWLQNKLIVDLSSLKPTQQQDLKKLFAQNVEVPVPKRRLREEDSKGTLVNRAKEVENTKTKVEKSIEDTPELVLRDETNTHSPSDATINAKGNDINEAGTLIEHKVQDMEKMEKLIGEVNTNRVEQTIKKKPSMTTTKKSTKKETSSVKEVKLEDIGNICSFESAEEIVSNSVPREILEEFYTGTWKEKQKKLQDLKEWLERNQPDENLVEALAVWLKGKLKDFKEKNSNILKETLDLLTQLANSTTITKKFANVIILGLFDKISDTKLSTPCQNLFLSISDSATPSYVASLVISSVYILKSISAIKNVLELLIRMIEDYTAKLIPMKIVLDCAKHYLHHSNVQVRATANKVIVSIYSQLGEEVKPLIFVGVKEASKKMLEDELASVKIQNSIEVKRKLKGESEVEWKSKSKSDPINSLAPRTNIAPLITSKLISDITSTSMKTRQNAKDSLEKILTTANNRILSTGLSTLMNSLKTRMNEPCKNLAKEFITLVGNLAAAMGSACKQYSKLILQPMMFNLADKQTGIHNETLSAISKFAEAAGHEIIFNNMGPLLEKDNPELRTEVLNWILKNKNHLSKADTNSLVHPLVDAMQDRSKVIRSHAEEVVIELLPFTGYQAFYDAIKDLKPAIRRSLETFLDKHKAPISGPMEEVKANILSKFKDMEEELQIDKGYYTIRAPRKSDLMSTKNVHRSSLNSDNSEQIVLKGGGKKQQKDSSKALPKEEPVLVKDNRRATVNETPKSYLKPVSTKNVVKRETVKEQNEKPLSKNTQKRMTSIEDKVINSKSRISYKNPKPELKKPAAAPSKTVSAKALKKEDLSASSSTTNLTDVTTSSTIGRTLIPTKQKDSELEIVKNINTKKERADEEKGMKWPINNLTQKHVEELKNKLSSAVNTPMLNALFSNDPQKNMEAVNKLIITMQVDPILIIEIIDLVFKWCSMKLGTNGNLSKSIVEFLSLVFGELYRTHSALQEFESASIIPVLCEKLGTNLKDDCKNLIKKVRDLLPVSKIHGYLIESLTSNNNKTKSEALEIIIEFMKACNSYVVFKSDIQSVSKLLNVDDKKVQKVAIEFLFEMYKEKKKELWNIISDISDKNKKMLKQKFEELENPKGNIMKSDMIERESYRIANTEHVSLDKDLNEKHSMIKQCLELLKSDSIVEKSNGLITLNVKVLILAYQDKSLLVSEASNIFMTLTEILKNIEAPSRFVKCYLEILKNLCGLDFMIKGVEKSVFTQFVEQLLKNLHAFSKRTSEDDICIRDLLNDTLISLMNTSELIRLFKVFLGTLKTEYSELSIKCLMKLNNSLQNLIFSLDLAQLLLVFNEHLENNEVLNATSIVIIRTLVTEVVKLKGKSIWDSYNKAFKDNQPDNYLKLWINISLNEGTKSIKSLEEIFKGLGSEATFKKSIRSLNEYMVMHPEMSLEKYLLSCSKPFGQLIIAYLNEYRINDKINSTLDHKMKMKYLMQKLGMVEEKHLDEQQSINDFSIDSP